MKFTLKLVLLVVVAAIYLQPTNATSIFKKFADDIKHAAEDVAHVAVKAADGTKNVADKLGDDVKNTAIKVADGTRNAAEKIADGTKNVADKIGDDVKHVAKAAAKDISIGAKDAAKGVETAAHDVAHVAVAGADDTAKIAKLAGLKIADGMKVAWKDAVPVMKNVYYISGKILHTLDDVADIIEPILVIAELTSEMGA